MVGLPCIDYDSKYNFQIVPLCVCLNILKNQNSKVSLQNALRSPWDRKAIASDILDLSFSPGNFAHHLPPQTDPLIETQKSQSPDPQTLSLRLIPHTPVPCCLPLLNHSIRVADQYRERSSEHSC